MTDRYGSYPPDEPVIGATYPPSAGSAPPRESEAFIGGQLQYEDELSEPYDGDDYDDEFYDDDEYYDDDGYYGEAPARQPMFYAFIGLAALIGGVIIFLLFTLVNSDGGGSGGAESKTAADFKIFIDSPTPNKRLEIGKSEDVTVRAKATVAISRFELFVSDRSVDSLAVTDPPAADGTYSATLRLTPFDRKGNYQLFVRVTSASGEHKDSDKVTVVAIEPVGAKPQFVNGKVVATANLREGPGDNFPVVKTLDSGAEVKILGKTRDGDWLLIDVDNGRWVKRNAIQEQDSLSLVPVKDPTPVPLPTATNTPEVTPSPSPSATPNAKAPDFVPQTATLADGGAKLRVTIANQSSNSYTGPLVVAVSGVNPGTLSLAFNVNIPAGGSATVEFELNPPVTTAKTATIRVDPDNAVKELNEDNNRVDVGLQPPVASPEIAIKNASVATDGSITVVITNSGGALPSSPVTVRVSITVGGSAAEKTQTIALAKGQESTFTVTKPGSGAAKVEVLIAGTSVASRPITLP